LKDTEKNGKLRREKGQIEGDTSMEAESTGPIHGSLLVKKVEENKEVGL